MILPDNSACGWHFLALGAGRHVAANAADLQQTVPGADPGAMPSRTPSGCEARLPSPEITGRIQVDFSFRSNIQIRGTVRRCDRAG
jgi:hypothetical protein